jgi:hypothetical protein
MATGSLAIDDALWQGLGGLFALSRAVKTKAFGQGLLPRGFSPTPHSRG